MIPHSLTGHHR